MTLDEARVGVGRKVIYRTAHSMEEGVVTSVNDAWVFVRYGSHTTSLATAPESLTWTLPTLSQQPNSRTQRRK